MWFDAEMKRKDITDGVGYSCLTGSPSYVFYSISMQVKLALFFFCYLRYLTLFLSVSIFLFNLFHALNTQLLMCSLCLV